MQYTSLHCALHTMGDLGEYGNELPKVTYFKFVYNVVCDGETEISIFFGCALKPTIDRNGNVMLLACGIHRDQLLSTAHTKLPRKIDKRETSKRTDFKEEKCNKTTVMHHLLPLRRLFWLWWRNLSHSIAFLHTKINHTDCGDCIAKLIKIWNIKIHESLKSHNWLLVTKDHYLNRMTKKIGNDWGVWFGIDIHRPVFCLRFDRLH